MLLDNALSMAHKEAGDRVMSTAGETKLNHNPVCISHKLQGTMPRILAQNLDHHSVPVTTVKFFVIQFEFDSSFVHMKAMIASKAQHSQYRIVIVGNQILNKILNKSSICKCA